MLISIIWCTSPGVMPHSRVVRRSTAVFGRWLFVLVSPVAVMNARVFWSRHVRLSAQKKNAAPMPNSALRGAVEAICAARNKIVSLPHVWRERFESFSQAAPR